MKKDTTNLLIALGCGFLVFLVMVKVLSKPAGPQIPFVSAEKSVARGAIFTKDDLALTIYKGKDGANKLFLRVEDVVGQEATADIPKGAFIEQQHVQKPELEETKEAKIIETPTLPIPEGMRAFTFAVRETEGISELIKIGSYVDILGTAPSLEGKPELQTIIGGTQVIAMEKTAEAGVEPKSITVALTPKGVLAVSNTVTAGKVRIIPRSDVGGGSATVLEVNQINTEIIKGTSKEQKTITERSGQ